MKLNFKIFLPLAVWLIASGIIFGIKYFTTENLKESFTFVLIVDGIAFNILILIFLFTLLNSYIKWLKNK